MDGELIASLTPQQRVDMIQKGYLPGREEEVRRYFAKEKPTGEALGLAIHDTGDGFSKTMGEGHMSYSKDYALVKSQYGDVFNEDLPNLSDRDFSFDKPVTKASVADRMKSYKTESSLDDKVGNILNNRQNPPVTHGSRKPIPPSQQQPRQTPIAVPRSSGVIMEAQQAKQLGYKNGVRYLNAFIRLLKEPNAQNRINLIEAMNDMVLQEQSLHQQLIKEYRIGLSTAESKVYEQIKTSKKNVNG